MNLLSFRQIVSLGAALCGLATTSAAATYYVTGGTTGVELDADVLADMGLTGPANPLMLTVTDSTFGFSTTDWTAWGSLDHLSDITFSDDMFDYTLSGVSIKFDSSRQTGGLSGLYVEDLGGVYGILADIGGLWSAPLISGDSLSVAAHALFVAPELANLIDADALSGAEIGSIWFEGTVRQASASVPDLPSHGVTALLMGALFAARCVRRRLGPAAA